MSKTKKKPIELVAVTLMVRRSSIEKRRQNLIAKRSAKEQMIKALGAEIAEIDTQIDEYNRVLVKKEVVAN